MRPAVTAGVRLRVASRPLVGLCSGVYFDRVLVVDDEPEVEVMFRQGMRRDIRSGSYELFFAGSGSARVMTVDSTASL